MKFFNYFGFALLIGGLFFVFALVVGLFVSFESKREEVVSNVWTIATFIGLVSSFFAFWWKRRDDQDKKGNHFQ